jgi:hypothetical protein
MTAQRLISFFSNPNPNPFFPIFLYLSSVFSRSEIYTVLQEQIREEGHQDRSTQG